MGFFSKILGIDKGIDLIARDCVKHMQQVQKLINSRDDLIAYLHSNTIPYGINENGKDIIWDLKLSSSQIIRFRTNENHIMGNFDMFSSNPLNPITFIVNDEFIAYYINYSYKRDNVPLPSACQTFIKSLESRNIINM